MKIAMIVGSLRQESFNKKLAEQVVDRLPESADVEFVDIRVPFFSEDIESDAPKEVLAQAEIVKRADAVIVLSPEYNRAIPGALKNLLDWLSRPCTGMPLEQKAVAIGGTGLSPVGTAAMQQQLRALLLQMNAYVLGQPTIMMTVGAGMSADGELADDASAMVQKFVDALLAFAEKVG